MNISAITSGYSANNSQVKRGNVQFTGNLGDKFVNQVLNGTALQPKEVIKEMKGTFGINSAKAEDIMESFIDIVRKLFKEKMGLSVKVNEQEKTINAFPNEKQDAVWNAEAKVRESFQSVIKTKNEEVAAKDKELADMKTKLEKYQQVAKVKSVEELDTIMPDKAIELIDELMTNKIPARRSMAEFLLSGKGQEDALAQIERNNTLMKASQDGIMNIPEVDVKVKELNGSGVWFNNTYWFTLDMIEKALKGSPKGSYIKSRVIKDQIKENAMAILTPMADNRYCNTSVDAISKELDKRLISVEKYHDGIAKGMEKMKANRDWAKVEYESVDFAPEDCKVIMTTDGGVQRTDDYNWLSSYGNSNW